MTPIEVEKKTTSQSEITFWLKNLRNLTGFWKFMQIMSQRRSKYLVWKASMIDGAVTVLPKVEEMGFGWMVVIGLIGIAILWS